MTMKETSYIYNSVLNVFTIHHPVTRNVMLSFSVTLRPSISPFAYSRNTTADGTTTDGLRCRLVRDETTYICSDISYLFSTGALLSSQVAKGREFEACWVERPDGHPFSSLQNLANWTKRILIFAH
eukprot:scaffold11420_cov80-Cylindrotheca_fusiformis.AAC.3